MTPPHLSNFGMISQAHQSLAKDVENLLGHVGLFPRYLMGVTLLSTLIVSIVFFATYKLLLKHRIEGEHDLSPVLHFTKNVLSHLVAFRSFMTIMPLRPPAGGAHGPFLETL